MDSSATPRLASCFLLGSRIFDWDPTHSLGTYTERNSFNHVQVMMHNRSSRRLFHVLSYVSKPSAPEDLDYNFAKQWLSIMELRAIMDTPLKEVIDLVTTCHLRAVDAPNNHVSITYLHLKMVALSLSGGDYILSWASIHLGAPTQHRADRHPACLLGRKIRWRVLQTFTICSFKGIRL